MECSLHDIEGKPYKFELPGLPGMARKRPLGFSPAPPP